MERSSQDWVLRSNRRETSLHGIVKRADGSTLRVLVSNISYEGCHLWCEGELERGELVELNVTQMKLMRAQVRWVSGDSAGAKFITGDSVVDERRARLGI